MSQLRASAAPHGPHLRRTSSTGRVEAFSDGVMAIAITLLVLELKVPDPATSGDGNLLHAPTGRWPSYVAYLAAFTTVGVVAGP